ncbi:MAG: hypothetical protein AAF922_04795 [Pseudomonadota bacterium]
MTGRPNDDSLESFFRAARSNPETPDSDLLARVLEAAEQEQIAQTPGVASAGDTQSAPFLQRWTRAVARLGLPHAPLRALGGWPVTAGFVAAAGTGIWIGALPQSPVATSGIFVVSDAGTGFGDWGDLTAFGLASESSVFENPADALTAEDVE